MKVCVKVVFPVLLAAIICLARPVLADRGMIPVKPEVSVFEPGQKAIVAWNGTSEILILSTDVTSSAESLVLEMLPLPSMPRVAVASFESFEELQRLIWVKGVELYRAGEAGPAEAGKGVEVVFHEKIGAHDVTVVEASRADEFAEWVRGFLARNGVEGDVSLEKYEPVLAHYFGRGFRYFVLDLVSVRPDVRSVEPIFYQFDSDFLYYPLVITSPVGGKGEIVLFVITREKLSGGYDPLQLAFYEYPDVRARKPIQFKLSKGYLSKIDLRLGELFDEEAWLTILRYKGDLGLLREDLMIASGATESEVDAWPLATYVALSMALGAALGSACTLMVIRLKRFVRPA